MSKKCFLVCYLLAAVLALPIGITAHELTHVMINAQEGNRIGEVCLIGFNPQDEAVGWVQVFHYGDTWSSNQTEIEEFYPTIVGYSFMFLSNVGLFYLFMRLEFRKGDKDVLELGEVLQNM